MTNPLKRLGWLLGICGALGLTCAGCSSKSKAAAASGGSGGLAGTGGTAGAAGVGGSSGSGGLVGTGGAAGAAGATGGSAGVDAGPSCNDGIKNADETDVDCGGSCSAKCGDNKSCKDPADCQSKTCNVGTCAAPTCADGVLNGSESDVDCGAGCPNQCDVGQGCKNGNDCTQGVCPGGSCVSPKCDDTVKNGNETDVDCGGTCPNKCGDGLGCGTKNDCKSAVCDPTTKTCKPPACDDTIKNGNETDIDCGGTCTNRCGDGLGCGTKNDCKSAVCDPTVKTCKPPACNDTVKNGNETDVDCGGSCAPLKPCGWGLSCQTGSDCNAANGVCAQGKCTPVPVGTWLNAAPAQSPSALQASTAAMFWDDVLSVGILFGGNKCCYPLSDEMWAWNGATWAEMSPALKPPPVALHSMAYDSVSKKGVLYGGSGMTDTWVWDSVPQTWSKVAGTGGTFYQSLAMAPSGKLLVSGNLTRVWNGLAWTNVTGSPSPPILNRHASAYDSKRNRTVIFGGSSDAGVTSLAETWEWDGTAWIKRTPLTAPGARHLFGMAYDSVRDKTIIAGGVSTSNPSVTYVCDTWEWDGNAWLKTGTSPCFLGSTMVFDPVRRRVVLYNPGGLGSFANQTWEYYVLGSLCSGANDCAVGTSCVDGLCCASASCGGGEACNTLASPGTCAVP